MAITYVNGKNAMYDSGSNVTTATTSFDATGVDLLVVVIEMLGQPTSNLTSLTFNGTAMTYKGVVETFTNYAYQLYELADPDQGTYNVVATLTTAERVRMFTEGYGGASGIGATRSFDNEAPAHSLTTTADNSWLAMVNYWESFGVAGTGTTFRSSFSGSDNDYDTYYDSNGSVGVAGSYSLDTTRGVADGIIFEIQESGGGGGAPDNAIFFGGGI